MAKIKLCGIPQLLEGLKPTVTSRYAFEGQPKYPLAGHIVAAHLYEIPISPLFVPSGKFMPKRASDCGVRTQS
jgi:hypothetical protein